jgi:hypothetical protein
MADLLIRFRRPDAMSDSEMRAWLARRARSWRPATALQRDDPEGEARLRVSLAETSGVSTEDYLLRVLMSDAG